MLLICSRDQAIGESPHLLHFHASTSLLAPCVNSAGKLLSHQESRSAADPYRRHPERNNIWERTAHQLRGLLEAVRLLVPTWTLI